MRATFPELWMDVNIHNVDLVTTGREERAGWVITVSSTEHVCTRPIRRSTRARGATAEGPTSA